MTEKQYIPLRQRLERHLAPGKDSVRFYPPCATCQGRVETVGSPKPVEPELFIV